MVSARLVLENMADSWSAVQKRLLFGLTILLHLSQGVFCMPKDVITEPHTTVVLGSQSKLMCKNNTTAEVISVTWGKGTKPGPFIVQRTRETGISPIYSDRDQRFQMGDDYNLIINDTKLKDNGSYWCQISYKGRGNYYSITSLSVKPEETTQKIVTDPDPLPENNGQIHQAASTSASNVMPTINTENVVVSVLFTLGLVSRQSR